MKLDFSHAREARGAHDGEASHHVSFGVVARRRSRPSFDVVRRLCASLIVVLALGVSASAWAQDEGRGPASSQANAWGQAPNASGRGVAVLASGDTRAEAFELARAVYGSALRPPRLDELRARILAGDPAPSGANKELRELAELRKSIAFDDAASRRLLSSIAQQLGVRALLVVARSSTVEARGSAPDGASTSNAEPVDGPNASVDAGAPSAANTPEALADAGATESTSPSLETESGVSSDAGVASPSESEAPSTHGVVARLFLAESGEFDAARYEPSLSASGEPSRWSPVVASLLGRFPPAPASVTAQLQGTPPKLASEGNGSKPFYKSPWLWGALGAAALVGGFFWFASRDTGDDPIHLQMRVPR